MITARTFQAWSCTLRVVCDARVVDAAVDDLAAIVAAVDRAASRFRPDSELSLANRRAGTPVAIGRLLTDLVADSLVAAEVTGGMVDPTMGAALSRWGYDRDIGEVRDVDRGDPDVAAPRPASWRAVRLDRALGLLTVPRDAQLDLGATAKAATADRAAQELHARYAEPVLVELGGDLAVAGAPSGGWIVEVAEREGESGQAVALRSGGMATSTTTVRRWRRGRHPVHHIIDPRTGDPATGCWRTATVVARSALAANTASTAAIILGEDALKWLGDRGRPARLVNQSGDVVTTNGWPTTTAIAS